MIFLPIGVLLQATCVARKAILSVFEVQSYTIFSFGGYSGMGPFAKLPPPPKKKGAWIRQCKNRCQFVAPTFHQLVRACVPLRNALYLWEFLGTYATGLNYWPEVMTDNNTATVNWIGGPPCKRDGFLFFLAISVLETMEAFPTRCL